MNECERGVHPCGSKYLFIGDFDLGTDQQNNRTFKISQVDSLIIIITGHITIFLIDNKLGTLSYFYLRHVVQVGLTVTFFGSCAGTGKFTKSCSVQQICRQDYWEYFERILVLVIFTSVQRSSINDNWPIVVVSIISGKPLQTRKAWTLR